MTGKQLEAILRVSGEVDGSLKQAIKTVSDRLDQLNDAAQKAQGSSADLASTISHQKKALQAAQDQYASYVLNGEEASQEAQALANNIRELSSDLSRNKAALSAAEKAAADLAGEMDQAGDSAAGAGDGIEDLKDSARGAKEGFTVMKGAIATLISAGIQKLIGSAVDAGKALMDLSEQTREFRQDMATLETAYDRAGFSAETATSTWKDLYGVFGEDDRAVETANNISRMAKTQQDLDKWVKITTGAWGTYQDALPVENLAEAAGETAKTGTVTGGLADALNWSSEAAQMFSQYMSDDVVTAEDAFNVALSKCSTEQERQALITDTLLQLYGGAAEKYEETAGSLMQANKAAADSALAQAQLGAAIEPVTTAWTDLKTELLTAVAPAVETVSQGLQGAIQWMREHPAVVRALVAVLAVLAAGITAVTIAVGIYTGVQMLANAALLPVIGIALAIVAAIAAVVAIVVVLRSHWDLVKQKAVEVWQVVQNAWSQILSAVSAAASAVSGVVTSVWSGLVSVVSGIWNGILSFLMGIWNTIRSAASSFVSGVVSVLSGWSALTSILTAPFRALAGIIDSVKAKVSGFVSAVKGIGGKVSGALGLKGYAKGGFTEGLSIAGEAGTEAVISFDPRYRADNLRYWAQAGRMLGAEPGDFLLSAGSTSNYIDMGGVTFAPNITITGSADRQTIMDAIEEEYPEFLDLLEEWWAERGMPSYA